MSPITKREILDNKFAFSKDEEILVNALDMCGIIAQNDYMKHEISRLLNRIDILETRLSLREFEFYKKIDLKA
jgi:hypothetical protein